MIVVDSIQSILPAHPFGSRCFVVHMVRRLVFRNAASGIQSMLLYVGALSISIESLHLASWFVYNLSYLECSLP